MLRLIRNSKAFTLVEILIVVAILGLLAAIAIPNLMKSREGAATTACKMNRAVVAKAIKIWATKRNETVAAMQTAFGTSAAKKTIADDCGGVTEIGAYLDVADAVCPSDDTVKYTSYVDSNGKVVIECPTHS